MSASKTETALLALVAALTAAAAGEGSPLPPPTRNADMLSQLVEVAGGDGVQRFLNVLDGDRANADEMLGADLALLASFDIAWRPHIEFGVAGGESVVREAAFDAMRSAIWDAIKPQVSGGDVTYLGGAVDSIRLVDMLPQDKSNAAGLPGVKASEFEIEIQYTSSAPF